MRRCHLLAGVITAVLVVLAGLDCAAESLPDQAIQREQRLLRRNPGDASAYHRLGDAYIQKARATGDMSYVSLAEASLKKSLALAPTRAGAARHLAYALATRHDFSAAAAEARRAIELDSKDADAWGVLGDAYLELGVYDQAGDAYGRMAELTGDLASYSRASGLKSLRGDVRGAIQDLERAVELGRASGQPRESIAWAEWQLGAEHFAIGEIDAALGRYQAALSTYPGYYRGLAGVAQVRAAQGRDAEAAELYARAIAATPFPEYAAALGDLYARMGRTAEARKQYELVEYIGRLDAVNQVLYNRELAYFYADHDLHVETAVELARRELEWRRDIYGHDVLAWALHKAGRSAEAAPHMDEALRLGTRDARLFFHAGMIHRALGHDARAREYLARALSINRHFHVLHADIAARALDELSTRHSAAVGSGR
jgi:tetratricopeptide (TPR) repeat protein